MDNLTRLYRIRKTCLEMLRDRGFLITQVRGCSAAWWPVAVWPVLRVQNGPWAQARLTEVPTMFRRRILT